MGVKEDNRKVFENGMKIAKGLIREHIISCLENAAYQLLVNAETEKEYHNLTGNTLTSYMVGIYAEKRLVKIVSMYDADSVERPTRGKLYYGSGIGVVMVEDYDTGKHIPIRKHWLMDTDKRYGEETSRIFLSSYKPKSDFALVMTTGTEYSEYLEDVKNLNVLTKTFILTPRMMFYNLKPMKQ